MIIATVSTQRSGTKMLAQCFKAGTVVVPYGEVFNPDQPQLGSFFEFMHARGARLISHGNAAVLDEFFAAFAHLRGIFGIDVMFNQVEIPCISWNDTGAPFTIYGYLRNAGAVVISLLRDPLDSFVSMKHLTLVGGRAHRLAGEDALTPLLSTMLLDEDEFATYRSNLLWHRETLKRSMKGYDLYYELAYNDLAKSQRLPEDLLALIARAAANLGMRVDPSKIQLHDPETHVLGIDYGAVFSNYKTLRRKYRPMRASGVAVNR